METSTTHHMIERYSGFGGIGKNTVKLNNVHKHFPGPIESQTKNSVCNHKEDLPVRVHNYLNALLSKHWEKLLKLINQKRNSTRRMQLNKSECRSLFVKMQVYLQLNEKLYFF